MINGLEFLSKMNINFHDVVNEFRDSLNKDFVEDDLVEQLKSGEIFGKYFSQYFDECTRRQNAIMKLTQDIAKIVADNHKDLK